MGELIERAETGAVAAEYLTALNLCFPGWGGAEMFDWCFRRSAGGPQADLLAFREAGILRAGSALTYRRVAATGEAPRLVACMTGSWTLPEARGQGLFKAMIEASRRRAAEQGCAFLLAFARESNPSAGALLRAGAHRQRSWYCVFPGERLDPVEEVSESAAEAAFFRTKPHGPAYRFVYTPEEWRGQMLRRPHPVRRLRLRHATVLVEAGPGAFTLLAASGSGTDAAARAAVSLSGRLRPMRIYATGPGSAEMLAAPGLTVSPGGLFVLPARSADPARHPWSICGGDRM